MMWFTADLHLGDTNILHDMDRPFDSVEEMNRKVIDAINECVAVDDRLYILGDFTYRLPLAEAVRLRERIECQNVTLIRGNHDGDWEDPDAPHIWDEVRDYLEVAPRLREGPSPGNEPLPHAQLERQGAWRHHVARAYPQQGRPHQRAQPRSRAPGSALRRWPRCQQLQARKP